MKRVLLSWSSGKDSAWTLHALRRDPTIELCGLITTLNAEFDRVAMHGVRRAVLEAQAAAAGLPLWIVPLPWPCSNEIYEQRMAETCQHAIAEKIDAVAFGDLFLEDVRSYRIKQLAPTGLEPLFPLWQIPTDALAREMIAGGLRARLSCVDTKQLPASLCRPRIRFEFVARFASPAPIHAASAASSIPASTRDRCSRRRCRSKQEKLSRATDLRLPISQCRPPKR